MSKTLDSQIRTLGFWSAIIAIATTVISFALPLDVPDGYSAANADRVAWLVENRNAFVTGWVNQIISMLSLSAVLFCGAWLAGTKNPIRGILAAGFVSMATMAFFIPKFIAIWTIPFLAEAISTGGAGAEMASSLLPILNVSIPFSLYTSFDYLGFWLYSLYALVAAGLLYEGNLITKLSSISLGLFGVLYQILLLALLAGGIAAAEIETWFLGVALLLILHVVLMVIVFKKTKAKKT